MDASGSYVPADTANTPSWYKAIALAIDILLPAKSMVAWDNNYVGTGLNVAAYQLNQFAYPNMAGKSADIVKTAIDDLGKIQTDLSMERDLDPMAPKAAEYRTRIEKVRNDLRNLIAPAPTKKKKKLGPVAGELYKEKVKEGGDMYKKKVAEGIRQAKGGSKNTAMKTPSVWRVFFIPINQLGVINPRGVWVRPATARTSRPAPICLPPPERQPDPFHQCLLGSAPVP